MAGELLRFYSEGCLMCRMNKFTLPRAFAIGIGGKDYEIEDQDGYLLY